MYNVLCTHLKHQKSIPYFLKRFFIFRQKLFFSFLIANFVSWIIFKPLIQWIPNLIIKRNLFFSISRICIMFQCFACNGILDSFTLNFFIKENFYEIIFFYHIYALCFLISMINSLCYLVIVCVCVFCDFCETKVSIINRFYDFIFIWIFLFLKINCTFESEIYQLLRHEEIISPSKLIG